MKRITTYVTYGMLLIAFVGVIYVLRFVTPMLTVESGSMEPTLPTGSRIVTQDQDSYKIGDVITFRADDGDLTTHRLVEFAKDDSLVTKGDANLTPDVWDKPVAKSDVLGKVIYMTPITTWAFWTTLRGLGIIVCLLVIVVMGFWRTDESNEPSAEA
ncbi:MAG: signal peptidase I [Patescibacteria group bacterium]